MRLRSEIENDLLRFGAAYSRYMNGNGDDPTEDSVYGILDTIESWVSEQTRDIEYVIDDNWPKGEDENLPEIAERVSEKLIYKMREGF